MSEFLNRLRAEFEARGSRVIDAGDDGIGVEFRDGNDAWWILPDDPLSSVPVPSSDAADPSAILAEYERLDGLRFRAIHAIRHHLANQGVRTARVRNGDWPIQQGIASSQLIVGVSLTVMFAESDDVVAAVRDVFTNSIIKPPSPRRIQRYLADEGDPHDELPWSEEAIDVESAFSPMTVLAMMGLCKAISLCGTTSEDGRPPSPEKLADAAQPRGRVGQALARFAAELPDASAWLELLDGAMQVQFDDGLDQYRIHPKSRDLATSIRRNGPERTGDDLVAEYRRLNTDRARVITALRVALPKLGFRVQDEHARLHFGPGVRLASLDLGEPLTEALRRGTAKDAVRSLLPSNPELAESVADALPSEMPENLPEPTTAVLPPPKPPPVSILQINELDLAHLDQVARSIIDRYLGQREVLSAYFDSMLYDVSTDTWATRDDWLDAANRFRGKDFINPNAELIRLELGVTDDLSDWMSHLRQLGRHGENSDAEIISVFRYRHDYPDIGTAWFAAEPFEDCPEAEIRARIGDWIASRFLAASIDSEDDDVWGTLSKLTPNALDAFFDSAQIERWRNRAVHEIEETWNWVTFDHNLLRSAAVHGWPEVGAALSRNPYLIHALVFDGSMQIFSAGNLFLAWSRLVPSIETARLVGTLLGSDLQGKARTLAIAMVGDLKGGRSDFVSQCADRWLTELLRGLAIAWTRCRPSITL